MSENINIEEILLKIIDYKDENNIHLLSKFSIPYLNSLIEKDKITQMERAFKEYDKKGVDIIDFVRIFLNILEHQPSETLYLIIALVEFFRIISENLNMVSYLKFQDITNYVCDSYAGNSMDDYILKTKKLPETKKFNAENQGIREIDINAPPIYGISEESLKRLVQSKLATDSSHHNNQSIKMGTFAKEIKKVFTLDSLSDRINIYNLDCDLEKSLMQRSLKEKKDVIILSFAWSNRQQRIGATLKDFSLIFWDAHDGFAFEKRFFISSFSNEYQSNIWFIEYLNLWLTSDKSNALNCWDIEKESLLFQLSHKKIQSTIIDVVEMPVIRLVAVGSLDKLVTIWDFYKRSMVLIIDLNIGGIHSLLYFHTYQVLVTAGYENSISVFEINPLYLDQDLVGKLVGHNSMVTAIQCIEKTPILVSADDNGVLKLWDIRTFKCIQTVELGSKTVISKILDVGNLGKICFLGSRVNFLEFDETETNEGNDDIMYAIKVEYNYLNDELIICTRKDLRFLDLETGRIKKIYRGLLRKRDDEITVFKSVEQNKKFIIGDHKGGLMMFLYSSGEKCCNLNGHSNEISTLKVDFTNKLYISGGWDSSIIIQKEEKNCFEMKREIKNCFHNKEINLIDVSIYHNIIVMISNSKTIYLWDYEYCRLLGSIDLEEGMEPTNVAFINGYGILIISTTNCRILIIHFDIKEQNIEFKVLATINLESHDKKEDSDEEEEQQQPLESNKLRDLAKSSMKSSELRASIRASAFLNSRKSLINNLEEIKPLPLIMQEDENSEDFKEKLEKKISNTANKLLIDTDYARENEEPLKCKLLLGLIRGGIRIYDIFSIFTENNLELYPHANKRMNYNAFRGAKEDFNSAIKKVKNSSFLLHSQKALLKLNKNMLVNFQAHKEQLTTLVIITLSEKRILSSSLDCFIKIWSLNGEKLAAVNINHPLPITWELKLDKIKRTRKNILFALKIVELIFRRYKRAILLSEEKNLNVNNFLSFLSNNNAKSPGLKLPSITRPIEENASNLVLLRQEYSPRDLHYDDVKHIYQREIMGPSLKEMEANKQLQIAQKIWRSERENSEDNARFFARDYLTKKNEERAYKEKDAMLFFQNEFREKLIFSKSYDDYPENVQKFSKKLEVSIKKKKPNVIGVTTDQKPIDKGGKTNAKGSPKIGKTLILPALSKQDPIERFDKGGSMKINRSRINETSSLLNDHKQTFLEYASVKNLLDSTNTSKLPNRNSQSVSINNNSITNYIGGSNNFKNILKNLDRNLKKSMNLLPKMELPRRQSDMLINLLDNSESFVKPKSTQRKKKTHKKTDFKKHMMFNNEEDDSNLNSNESQHDIDSMLADILKNVQEKVKKKLEIELLMRKKEWEIETKRKIMMEFRDQESKQRDEFLKEKEEQKIVREAGGGMGFGTLGHVFKTINKN